MIQKTILEALKAEYESGKTQEEIARKYNISQVIINRLLSGKRKVGGLTLNTVCKMFPRMSVNLNGGDCPVVIAKNNAMAVNAANAHHNNFLSAQNDVTDKIISAVMASDRFDPAAKVELYNIVKNIKDDVNV